ncbi:hypothetical protein [Castellaniella sp.]|uniref:hypothetical protein n=1 Tax=Castellaniella sp. TaxID=1955812 RepID=UPI003C7894D0
MEIHRPFLDRPAALRLKPPGVAQTIPPKLHPDTTLPTMSYNEKGVNFPISSPIREYTDIF